MNVASTARCFCLVVFIGYGYIFHLTDSLSVNDVYTDNNAEFTCVISPYTGSQRWYIDSVIVAFCGAIVCATEPTNPGRYNFTPNVGTGTFIFKIDPTERTDDNKIVGCYDGTDTKTLTINLPVDSSTVTDEPGLGTGCIVGICFGTFVFLAVVIGAIVFVCVQPVITRAKMEISEIELEWTDWIDCFCQGFFKYNIVCERIVKQQESSKDRQEDRQEESTKIKKYKLKDCKPNHMYKISLSRMLCCCKSLARKTNVITKKSDFPDYPKYDKTSTTITVELREPRCITNRRYTITCNNEVVRYVTGVNCTIEDLIPGKTYDIKAFAIGNDANYLLLAEQISTEPMKVIIQPVDEKDVSFDLKKSCVNCTINWKVVCLDQLEHPNNNPGKLHYDLKCSLGKQEVHIKKRITGSSYTIPNLPPNRAFSIDVWAIYRSVRLEPHGNISFKSPPLPKSDN